MFEWIRYGFWGIPSFNLKIVFHQQKKDFFQVKSDNVM